MPTLSVQCIKSHHHSCMGGATTKSNPAVGNISFNSDKVKNESMIRHSLAMSLEQGTMHKETPSLLQFFCCFQEPCQGLCEHAAHS